MMSREEWQQIELIVDRALDLPMEARASYIQQACGDNQELRAHVDQMLRSVAHASGFLNTPAPEAQHALLSSMNQEEPALIGSVLGPYRIRKELGRGGMGAVYLAERADDQFRQRVAIKLIRRGMDTEDILQRFRNERQILAALDHPNIASILDGGMTPDGLPYFVMEYIEGVPIDTYCDRHKLSIGERLTLFRTVCSAVQYAHQNLIVHRDLKPSNILVTEDGQVKLLDFGIAKVINPQMTAENIVITRAEERLMTPEYASPEQVLGAPVTTASDVYALGVILYELLTGHRPYHLHSRVQHEIERVILGSEPTKPSTAITRVTKMSYDDGSMTDTITPETVSDFRSTQKERLKRNLRGDLDNIVMMALRKEPRRRYASAEHLSEDVRRHMNGLPVLARPDTLGYRMQKFVHRNKWGVTAAVMIFMSLIGGLSVALWQANVAATQRDRAQLEAQKAEEVKDFLVSLFKVSDPSESRGEQVTAREILDQGSERIDEELSGQPEIQAEMLGVVGEVYRSLGLYTKGGLSFRRALEARKALYGDEHPAVAESIDNLASVFQDQGDYEAAEPLFREALAMRRKLLGPEHPDIAASLNNLGLLLRDQSDYEAAEPLFREALAMRRKLLGDAHADYAVSINNLALLLNDQGKYDEAAPFYEETLALRRRLYGNIHPQVATALNNLAALYYNQGQFNEAEPLYVEALDIRRQLYQNTPHPDVASSLNNLANLLQAKEEYDRAETLFEEALGILQSIFGDDHQFVAITRNNLAAVLFRQGKYEEAERLLWRVLDFFRQALPEGHPTISSPLVGLGRMILAQGRAQDAEPLVREALTIRLDKLGDDHWMTAQAKSILGEILTARQSYTEAEPLLLQGYETIREVRGLEDSNTQDALRRLVALYEATNQPTDANRYRALIQDQG